MSDKRKQAVELIKNCIGKKGVWASNDRYAHQCWTRDFCLAMLPLFLYNKDLKCDKIVLEHLYNISSHQIKKSGKVPILFLDSKKKFIEDKHQKSLKSGKTSFMLQRYFDGGLADLTPHTRDSEVLFIIAVSEYQKYMIKKTNSSSWYHKEADINYAKFSALKYIENVLLSSSKLIQGADWRDVRYDLNDKQVLTNACLLYYAYVSLRENQKAGNILEIIQNNYWNGKYFIDYPGVPKGTNCSQLAGVACANLFAEQSEVPSCKEGTPGSDTFDLLGNSLVVLYDIADGSQKEVIFKYVASIVTNHGIKTTETFLPPLNDEEKLIMERDKAVIWPFTIGFMLEAMIKKGSSEWINFAKEELKKWDNLDGFYEWYDIVNGQGYGSKNQVWSAALYLRVQDCLEAVDKN
jgi:hypothetical protein